MPDVYQVEVTRKLTLAVRAASGPEAMIKALDQVWKLSPESASGGDQGSASARVIGDGGGETDDPEPPRADTDCACRSGVGDDCPCEADGPDGLCACCRTGEHNGSCVPALLGEEAGDGH